MDAKLSSGLYDQVVTLGLAELLKDIDPRRVLREQLDEADADALLARHVHALVWRALKSVRARGDEADKLTRQVELVNALLARLRELAEPAVFGETDESIADTKEKLLALVAVPSAPIVDPVPPPRPEIPLAESALLVNGHEQPRIGTEIARELASADSVDLLCAFVKWQGFRVLAPQLRELILRGGRLRVITTTYMGATDRRALDALVELGAEVRVSYETRTTRLHAKAWLFQRKTGFTTAYIGSSNLSRSALLDGLEWNVRVAAVEQPHVIETFRATFESYWEDQSFEPYDPQRDGARFDRAIDNERGAPPLNVLSLDVRPFPYQQEMLDQLRAERVLHGRWRNLVVAATGTGKTIVAALDYKRLSSAQDVRVDSLLFVAHRKEILEQSLSTFRTVMRDGAFGELYVDGRQPKEWRHVFASVQSLATLDLEQQLPANRFDMLIVDEFHHAMAPTYERLLRHATPKVLLGLTATPERTDGQDVKVWFDGRIAVELRLWDAIGRSLLAPFQYFGIHDDVDVSQVSWKRGGYDPKELSNVYTGNHARARAQKVAQAVVDRVADRTRMRALGFCVDVNHAEYMAERFNEFGIKSVAVSARSSSDQREQALRDLRDRKINVIFAVDLFNEGVDVPAIDTVLFLRPTESATVFLQQLGRGLRLSDDKPCLTALDFIGHQHARFRFDLKYRALTGTSRRELVRQLQNGFPYLPAGCHVELDRVASEIVLRNVRQALNLPWDKLKLELQRLGPEAGLGAFLQELGLELEDLYRRTGGGWSALRRMAGFDASAPGAFDKKLAGAIGRMLHMGDRERLHFFRAVLSASEPPRANQQSERQSRLLAMLHFSLWGTERPIEQLLDGLADLWREPSRRQELLEVLNLLEERKTRLTLARDPAGPVPLHVHAWYSLYEALAAFGMYKPSSMRQGVYYVEAERADLLFVTLRKTEHHYSPTTRYRDYAISSELFHWESQNATTERSKTGQRYVHHAQQGSSVHLFIRESKEGALGAPPYLYAGPLRYVSHEGERPMAITWRLEHALPIEILEIAKLIAA